MYLRTLADLIEAYLCELVARSNSAQIEIIRSELAERFSCVPSQINYVLATRFTPERGFVVESRRGGGGHVRITRIDLGEGGQIAVLLNETIGDSLDQETGMHICDRFFYEGMISRRERLLMEAAIRNTTILPGGQVRDQIRAAIMKAMVLALLKNAAD